MKGLLFVAVALLSWILASASADALELAHTGTYATPALEGEGLQVVVQPERAPAEQVVATWYTYTIDGAPAWLIAQGPIGGAMDVFAADRYGLVLDVRPVGVATLEAISCTELEVGWLLDEPALPPLALQMWTLLTDPVAPCRRCPAVDFSPRPAECE